MPIPTILRVVEIHDRLQRIFPKGSPNRNNCTWEIASEPEHLIRLYEGRPEVAKALADWD